MASTPSGEPSSSLIPSNEPTTEPFVSTLTAMTLKAVTSILSYPEPEAETTQGTAGTVPYPEVEVEPTPKWGAAKDVWGVAWPIHWIGFTVLFFIFSLAVATALIKMVLKRRSRRQVAVTKFSATVWTVLLIFGLSRAFYLLLNPYENGTCLFGDGRYCPLALNRILFSLGLPSLTTAFLLFHFAFLEVTKIKGAGRLSKLQNTPFLVCVTLFNYTFIIAVDLIVTYKASLSTLVSLCQGYFILLGLSIMIMFLYSASGIFLSSKKNWNSMQRIQDGKLDPELAALRRTRFYVTPQLQKVIRLTFLTVLIWSVYVLFQTIGFVVIFTGNLAEWPYLIFETLYRLCELSLGFSILYAISAKPKTNSNRRDQSTRTTFSRKFTLKTTTSTSPSTFNSDVKLTGVGDHSNSYEEVNLTNGSAC